MDARLHAFFAEPDHHSSRFGLRCAPACATRKVFLADLYGTTSQPVVRCAHSLAPAQVVPDTCLPILVRLKVQCLVKKHASQIKF
jgi:hypothetical protein